MTQGQSSDIKTKVPSLRLNSVGLSVGVGGGTAREVTRSNSRGIHTLLDDAGKL